MTISEFDLEGKVALVTGATRSIGRAIAMALAQAGADLAIAGRDLKALAGVRDEIQLATNRRVHPIRCDVSSPEQVESMVQDCEEHLAAPTIAVANSGIFQTWQPSEQLSVAEWDRVVDTDLRGVLATWLAAGRRMLQDQGGSIVTISSVAGLTSLQGTIVYNAAKAGVASLTRSLAVEWARRKIRVNCVAPGFIERDVEPFKEDQAVQARIFERTPLARWGTTREVALAVLFLASDAASFVTGATLPVDGGWLAA